MAMPDLNLLVTLDVLLSEGSVVRAARRLQLSASAMSRALARLRQETGDPLPLGGNGIRKDLDPAHSRRLCRLLTESIAYGLDHRQEALDYAMRYARGLEDDPVRSDRFVGMYVNDWTRDYGAIGRRAVQRLLDRGHDAGILPQRVIAEWVEAE